MSMDMHRGLEVTRGKVRKGEVEVGKRSEMFGDRKEI